MTDRRRTIPDLIAGHAGLALTAPGRSGLDYAGLAAQIDRAGRQLAGAGIGPGDAVGIVLPNGPEMATAFLSVASHAVAAPLNPAYTEEEFAFYLDDLKAKHLIVMRGAETPARAAAARCGAQVIELSAGEAAGEFTLSVDGTALAEAPATRNRPEDTALVLHTSGTTSRPKIVPLTARNICASAENVAVSLALSPADRCLNVMPLFHIHGLIAAVLASLWAGASISCTPGFDALKFFAWLESERPSWYTAVPTMHQAILARAPRNREIVERARLRFVRSSSASLPPPVLAALEETFRCPVIEAYGMTEAAHQMAANPLPPRARKPGTVGIAAGPEVAVMGENGEILAPGRTGEIVIRGENVTPGYLNNPKANAENFTNGWFRTGDQGVMDAEGYLTVTGRLKEIINRGGEKIAPREVDDVLMEHPAVAQVVTFALPHDRLGEEVAAAVVLAEGATADAAELREFAAKRLAPFKVPRVIRFVDEIPKGATGKLQRIGLAEKLGMTA
ncbi:MAG: AMP-dependent synthetase [Alphaproteobacteria bacterium]|nr:MAG: AMP-dependent synthetase [Alphaproteobacteria bacterium]